MSASATMAQDKETGSRLRDRQTLDENALSQKEAIYATKRWATCVYSLRDRTVRRLLTTLDMADFRNAADLVYAKVDCDILAGGPATENFSLNTSLSTDRGMFAEAALEAEGHLKRGGPTQPSLPMAEGYNRPWFEMTDRPNFLNAMAICIAETQPALTVALLRSERSSDEEQGAIGNLSPHLGGCLQEGAQFTANVFQLRNAMADAYFQRIYGENGQITIEQPQGVDAVAGEKS